MSACGCHVNFGPQLQGEIVHCPRHAEASVAALEVRVKEAEDTIEALRSCANEAVVKLEAQVTALTLERDTARGQDVLNTDAIERMRQRIMNLESRLTQARDAVKAARSHHTDDSYGACVTCIRPHTDGEAEAWPCPTV